MTTGRTQNFVDRLDRLFFFKIISEHIVIFARIISPINVKRKDTEAVL